MTGSVAGGVGDALVEHFFGADKGGKLTVEIHRLLRTELLRLEVRPHPLHTPFIASNNYLVDGVFQSATNEFSCVQKCICDLSRKKGTISIFHTFTDFYVIPFSNVRSIKIWISEVYKLFGNNTKSVLMKALKCKTLGGILWSCVYTAHARTSASLPRVGLRLYLACFTPVAPVASL